MPYFRTMAYFRRRDYILMLIISCFPVIFFVGLDLLYYGESDQPMLLAIYSVVYSLIITAGLYTINSLLIGWLKNRYPWQEVPLKRLILEFLLSFIFSTAWQAFVIFVSLETVTTVSNVRTHYINNIVFGLAITYFVLLIMEGVYFFKLWRDSLTRVQRMEKQQLQTQLDQLKAQVQPHFLFNSLNTLSAMLEVEQDIPRAIKFIDEFSLLYRRILEKKDAQTIPLHEELRFVEAYLLLQKERFPNSLKVTIDVDEEDLNRYVLPMAIQELLENAIKHNRMSKSEPLHIQIYTQLHHLFISNPNRPKQVQPKGTSTGLANLDHRLRLLGAPRLGIEDGKLFTICLPLLPKEVGLKIDEDTES